ncbi:HAD family hydrolase [Serinibacter arcticus]|uniref:HAD family hydrolase n=1 Tax=Serinibacter arcticus TaxID=1655435 RepID=UPI001F1E0EC9|nr:HAD family hydrolase [Serinibacter arcticus]
MGFEGGWRVHDDVADLLVRLAEAGLAVGALTNAVGDLSARKLARCGLADTVPLLVSLDTFGVGKPDPRVFLEACRLLGTSPERTVYVGDELDTDALAATAAGLRGIWLDRPGTRRGGVHLEDPGVAREAGIAVVGSLDALGR